MVTSTLPCPAERLSDELGRPALFLHITARLLVFSPVEPPEAAPIWLPGVYRFRLLVGGLVPLGEHTVDAQQVGVADSGIAAPQQVWHDAGYSALIKNWDHKIILEPVGDSTRYTDEVAIHAGLLTVPAWLFAQVFYRHRQRRLADVVAADFSY